MTGWSYTVLFFYGLAMMIDSIQALTGRTDLKVRTPTHYLESALVSGAMFAWGVMVIRSG